MTCDGCTVIVSILICLCFRLHWVMVCLKTRGISSTWKEFSWLRRTRPGKSPLHVAKRSRLAQIHHYIQVEFKFNYVSVAGLSLCIVCSIRILRGVLLRLPIKATSSCLVSSSQLCLSIWKALGTTVVLAHVAALFDIGVQCGLSCFCFYFSGLLCGLPLDTSFLPDAWASCLCTKQWGPGEHQEKTLSAPSFTGNQLCLRPSYCLYQLQFS